MRKLNLQLAPAPGQMRGNKSFYTTSRSSAEADHSGASNECSRIIARDANAEVIREGLVSIDF